MKTNLVEVHFHGKLGKAFRNKWKLAISSVGEMSRSIEVLTNHKFYKWLIEEDKKGAKYRVLINGRDFIHEEERVTLEKPESIRNSELMMNLPNLRTIDIVPVIQGANSSLLTAILGVVLIIVGIVLLVTGVGSPLGVPLIIAGLGLLAAGVINLLSRPPKFDDFREIDGSTGRTSYLFNGPQNTTREGGPVPIGYDRVLTGSQVISASYVVSDFNAGIGVNDLPGLLDDSFSIGDHPDIYAFGLNSNGDIYVALYDNNVSPNKKGIFKLKNDGSTISYGVNTFNTLDKIGNVKGINFDNYLDRLYVNGDGILYANSKARNFAGYTLSNGIALNSSFDVSFNDEAVNTVIIRDIQEDNKILIGGNFDRFIKNNATTPVNKLAILNNTLSDVTIGDFHINNTVYSIYVYTPDQMNPRNRKIIIGGNFTTVGGFSRGGIAILKDEVSGFSLDNFAPVGINAGTIVKTLGIQTVNGIDMLIIGGNFTTINGTTQKGLARLSLVDGSLDTSFNANLPVNAIINSLYVQTNGKILIGGSFNTIDTVTANNIGRLNLDGSPDVAYSFPIGTRQGGIKSIMVDTSNGVNRGKFYVYGPFDSVGQDGNWVKKRQLARFHNAGYLDTT